MLVYQRVTIRVEESTSKMCHSNALDLFESSGVSTCSAWLIMTKVGPFIEPNERCAGMIRYWKCKHNCNNKLATVAASVASDVCKPCGQTFPKLLWPYLFMVLLERGLAKVLSSQSHFTCGHDRQNFQFDRQSTLTWFLHVLPDPSLRLLISTNLCANIRIRLIEGGRQGVRKPCLRRQPWDGCHPNGLVPTSQNWLWDVEGKALDPLVAKLGRMPPVRSMASVHQAKLSLVSSQRKSWIPWNIYINIYIYIHVCVYPRSQKS